MTKSHFKSFVAAFVAAIILGITGIFGGNPVFADEQLPVHLLVSPASHTLGQLEPGKSYESTFVVKNIGTEAVSFNVYPAPYYEDGENGDKTYDVMNSYTHLSEWITFDIDKGTLQPNEAQKVTYRVKVPTGTAGGAQNAAIMIESNDAIDETKVVSASSRIALVLFSQVSGETNACGKILDKNIPGLLLNPPIIASGRVENCGNIDLNVKYTLSVYPIFSDEEVYTNEEDPLVLATLPETRRFTSVDWESTPSFGLFRVKLDVTYAGNTETIEKIVLICPLWLIILIIVFVGAVVFWLVSKNRERKNSKKVVE